jgi:hypothetical protein
MQRKSDCIGAAPIIRLSGHQGFRFRLEGIGSEKKISDGEQRPDSVCLRALGWAIVVFLLRFFLIWARGGHRNCIPRNKVWAVMCRRPLDLIFTAAAYAYVWRQRLLAASIRLTKPRPNGRIAGLSKNSRIAEWSHWNGV